MSQDDRETPIQLTEEDVTCPVCLFIYVEPVKMPCNHHLCKTCFESIIQQATLQCPVCRTRIGTFARRARGKALVDEKLWSRIQSLFEEQLKLQKLNTNERKKDIEPKPVVLEHLSAPGDIRREFEKQIAQINGMESQLAEDERIAAELHKTLNCPASVTRQSTPAAPTPSSPTPSDCSEVAETPSESEEEEDSAPKKKPRRLFQSLCNSSSSEIEMEGEKISRPRKRKKTIGKENDSVGHKKQQRIIIKNKKSKQFPGCSLKPIIAGMSALANDSYVESDDEISVKETPHKHTSELQKNDNSKKEKRQKYNNDKIAKNKSQPSKDKNNHSKASENSINNEKLKNSKHDEKVSGNAIKNSLIPEKNSISPNNFKKRGIRKNKSEPCDDVAMSSGASSSNALNSNNSDSGEHVEELADVTMALLSGEDGDMTAIIAEQKKLEERLLQERNDAKLAVRIQKQLTKNRVDRSAGSGEEYKLRSRREKQSSKAKVAPVVVMTTRDCSPTY